MLLDSLTVPALSGLVRFQTLPVVQMVDGTPVAFIAASAALLSASESETAAVQLAPDSSADTENTRHA
jgi:hypothetical protein